jgi:23S rRNA (uracil1939-C5)-methyltransferase
VVRALARHPALELVYTEPVLAAAETTEYRTRAKLVVGARGEIGLFAKGGKHDVVDIPHCRVFPPVIAHAVAAIRARVAADRNAIGLRAIDVREVVGDSSRALVTLVVERSKHDESLAVFARALLAELPDLVGVAASLHDGHSPQILGSETVLLAGEHEADDRVGRSLQIATFGSFVQAHRSQATRVHDIIATHVIGDVKEKARVLDLYAGSGAIALALAASGADVTCVEAFGPAAARITRAAEREKASVRALHADVASAARDLAERDIRFDAVVVNPPRRGVEPAAREHATALDAPVIVYVSCDPDTLARDLDHFARLGYRGRKVQPLDMIPLSEEVETIATLKRTAPAPPRVLFEDDTAIFVDKSAHESTSPADARGLASRVRRLEGAEHATCVLRLDRGTSGVALYARTERDAEDWRRAFAGGSSRRVFLAGARGIVSSKGTLPRDSMHSTRIKYRRLSVFANHSIARVTLESSDDDRERTDVVRRLFATMGHPILGDERFGHAPTNKHFEEKFTLDRSFLHCVRIEVEHPRTNARLVIESPLAGDLATVLVRAGGASALDFLDQKNALGTSSNPPPPSSASKS